LGPLVLRQSPRRRNRKLWYLEPDACACFLLAPTLFTKRSLVRLVFDAHTSAGLAMLVTFNVREVYGRAVVGKAGPSEFGRDPQAHIAGHDRASREY